jgi:hypothetical protein
LYGRIPCNNYTIMGNNILNKNNTHENILSVCSYIHITQSFESVYTVGY